MHMCGAQRPRSMLGIFLHCSTPYFYFTCSGILPAFMHIKSVFLVPTRPEEGGGPPETRLTEGC